MRVWLSRYGQVTSMAWRTLADTGCAGELPGPGRQERRRGNELGTALRCGVFWRPGIGRSGLRLTETL